MIRKLIYFLLFCLIPSFGFSATHYVALTDGTFDGAGEGVVGGDTVIVRAGPRGSLTFQNIDGSGTYVTVVNEDLAGNIPVSITYDESSGRGAFNITNCKYVDFTGAGDVSVSYGFTVSGVASPDVSNVVWVYGTSDHLKISYFEIDLSACDYTATSAITVQDTALTSSQIYDTIDIHHNYIHDTQYAGMYLGSNDPPGEDNPYLANFSIHDNTLENLGAYGITYKGVSAGTSSIYNNTIKITGLVRDDLTGNFKQGIGVQYLYGASTVKVYGNWVEKTKGPGIKMSNIGAATPTVNIYENTMVGCGTDDSTDYGHGIDMVTYVQCNANVYDNKIVNSTRYGLWAGGGTAGDCDRNIISGGLGESSSSGGGVWTEGTGANANIYEADTVDIGYCTWSDDGDYSNDVFSTDCETVSVVATDPTATEAGTTTGTFTIDCDETSAGNCDGLSVAFTLGGTATVTDDYTATVSPVTITDASTPATVTITPVDDEANDDWETVVLTITASENYSIGIASDTVTIEDNDDPVGSGQISLGGTGSITIGGAGTLTLGTP